MISALVSVVVGFTAALVVSFVFVFYLNKPAQVANIEPISNREIVVGPTPFLEIPNPEIKLADVKGVTISTIFTGYFEPGSKCAKTYNEYFGNEDGVSSPSSPCTIKVTFDRDGHATKTIEVSRYEKKIKGKRAIEKSVWTGEVKSEDFKLLAELIVTNNAFKNWREGTMVNVSNCSISVEHAKETKTIMSNVGNETVVFLLMVEGFKKLDGKVAWKKTE